MISLTQLESDIRGLKQQISDYKNQIENLPDGKLFSVRRKNGLKWFSYLNGQEIYLSKAMETLKKQLAYKEILSLIAESDRIRLDAETACLKEMQRADAVFASNSKMQNLSALINSSQLSFHNFSEQDSASFQQQLQQWAQEDYQQNPSHPENKLFSSVSGNKVRSKSELLIDTELFARQIPFRYECGLNIAGTTVYPDFTIRHPKTGEIWLWEHFGLMDNPNYLASFLYKMELYTRNGYVPSINLITSYETKSHPFDSVKAGRIIRLYFEE